MLRPALPNNIRNTPMKSISKVFLLFVINVLVFHSQPVDAAGPPTNQYANTDGNRIYLHSGEYNLTFNRTQSAVFGIIVTNDAGETLFRQPEPISLLIKSSENNAISYSSGYTSVETQDRVIQCTGFITTTHGSVFEIIDSYSLYADNGGFVVTRKVQVKKAAVADIGFQSVFGLFSHELERIEHCSFFAPAVWYDKNNNVRPGAIGNDKHLEYYYIRTTRLSLPMMMMYTPSRKSYIALGHYQPNIGSGVDENSTDWLVDASIQYASVGIHKKPYPQLDFIYPGSEGEVSYVKKRVPWNRRSHPVSEHVNHQYSVLFKVGASEDYRAAMRDSWRYYYNAFSPEIVICDLDRVYKAGIDLLGAVTKEYFPGAMGTPFTLWIPDGKPKGISYQIGFTGQLMRISLIE